MLPIDGTSLSATYQIDIGGLIVGASHSSGSGIRIAVDLIGRCDGRAQQSWFSSSGAEDL